MRIPGPARWREHGEGGNQWCSGITRPLCSCARGRAERTMFQRPMWPVQRKEALASQRATSPVTHCWPLLSLLFHLSAEDRQYLDLEVLTLCFRVRLLKFQESGIAGHASRQLRPRVQGQRAFSWGFLCQGMAGGARVYAWEIGQEDVSRWHFVPGESWIPSCLPYTPA